MVLLLLIDVACCVLWFTDDSLAEDKMEDTVHVSQTLTQIFQC